MSLITTLHSVYVYPSELPSRRPCVFVQLHFADVLFSRFAHDFRCDPQGGRNGRVNIQIYGLNSPCPQDLFKSSAKFVPIKYANLYIKFSLSIGTYIHVILVYSVLHIKYKNDTQTYSCFRCCHFHSSNLLSHCQRHIQRLLVLEC